MVDNVIWNGYKRNGSLYEHIYIETVCEKRFLPYVWSWKYEISCQCLLRGYIIFLSYFSFNRMCLVDIRAVADVCKAGESKCRSSFISTNIWNEMGVIIWTGVLAIWTGKSTQKRFHICGNMGRNDEQVSYFLHHPIFLLMKVFKWAFNIDRFVSCSNMV